jgi:hypothetical protein
VDKGIVSAAVWRDETISLAFIKEFHRSGGHFSFLLRRSRMPARFLLGAKREGKGAAKRL